MVIVMQINLSLYAPKPTEFYFCGRCNKYRSPYTYGDDNRYYCHACTLNLISTGSKYVSSNPDSREPIKTDPNQEKRTRKRKKTYRYTPRTPQEDRENQILDLVREYNFLTAIEVGEKIGINKSSAYRLLKPMANNNLLVTVGKFFVDPTFWEICQDPKKLTDHIVITIKNNGGKMTGLQLREYYKILPSSTIDLQIKNGYRDKIWKRYRLGNPPNNVIVSLLSPSGEVISMKQKILDLIKWNPGINNRAIFKELESIVSELDATRDYHDCTTELKKEGLIWSKRTVYDGVCYYPAENAQQEVS